MRKVFTLRGLEKKTTLDVKLALEDRPGSGYGVHRPGLSEEEAGVVAGLLRRVRMFAATEGLIVKVFWRLEGNEGVIRLASKQAYIYRVRCSIGCMRHALGCGVIRFI